MIQDSIYTQKAYFEDVARDWYRVNGQLADMFDEFMNLYGEKIGEIGVLVFNKLLGLTKEIELLSYYLYRDNHTIKEVFDFMKREEEENAEVAKKEKI